MTSEKRHPTGGGRVAIVRQDNGELTETDEDLADPDLDAISEESFPASDAPSSWTGDDGGGRSARRPEAAEQGPRGPAVVETRELDEDERLEPTLEREQGS